MSEYEKDYMDQVNGYFNAPLFQRGYGMKGRGIGRMLRNFMRWISPLARKHIVPKIEAGAKFVGTNLVETLANVAKDTIEGQNINDAAKDRFQDLADDLKQKTENVLQGNGVKKKTAVKKTHQLVNTIILKNTKKTNKRKQDIFDLIKK
jgi:hypothetical protein